MSLKQQLPTNDTARLDPIRVQAYARDSGWNLIGKTAQDRSAIYSHPDAETWQITVPLSKQLPDFPQRMTEVVSTLADKEKAAAGELLQRLLLPESDILRFSDCGASSANGIISLNHGLEMLAGARRTILAAACGVVKPDRTYHPRMSLAEAEGFLAACKLGQTERGSFVLTIACPLQVPRAQSSFLPFARDVTTALMSALNWLSTTVSTADVQSPIAWEGLGEHVTANLCDGLLDMMPADEEGELVISATYSNAIPVADLSVPRVVRLPGRTFPLIAQIAERLRPSTTPRIQSLLGFVETLDGRPNEFGLPEGPVALRLSTSDGEIRARIYLPHMDHALAAEAYLKNQPVTLDGTLVRSGRFYEITSYSTLMIFAQKHDQVVERRQVRAAKMGKGRKSVMKRRPGKKG
ncbi:hypothetical protein Pan44_47580 [Caulifigura coniformis]|uniref:Uncharacterized protein n=1 Tax=Caulifigura coniformis TaxID=2527983 RepID=A0A517SKQ3_9PLAN|nr:hypothetical protein [Caulifigura coniformis]QDT56701.1 hypothetical protein Pan44_47580 [Caulifigura coniformis]